MEILKMWSNYWFIQPLKTIKVWYQELPYLLGQCTLCQSQCYTMAILCDDCLVDLPRFYPQHHNLLTIPKIANHISHQHFERLICLAPYQWPVDTWINQLKYHRQFQYAALLAKLLANHLVALEHFSASNNVHYLAVPIHIKRWQQRSYNQSHLIAEQLIKQLNLSYLAELIIRHKNTEKQVGKNGVLRRKNLKGAFQINAKFLPKVTNANFVIVDDVITTGTTVNEIAKLLKRHGARSVTVLTVAIALEPLAKNKKEQSKLTI
ncbi:MAG: ComF family protein [Thalassotalea sp.]